MAPADGSRHRGSDESISVAELLKRMGAGGSDDSRGSTSDEPPRRRRRADDGTGVSVAELTGEMPVLDADGKPMGRAARRRAREAEEAERESARPQGAHPESAAPTTPSQAPGQQAPERQAPERQAETHQPQEARSTAQQPQTRQAERGRPPVVRRTPAPKQQPASDKTPMPPKREVEIPSADVFGFPSGKGSHTGPIPVVSPDRGKDASKDSAQDASTGDSKPGAAGAAAGTAGAAGLAAGARDEKTGAQATDRPAPPLKPVDRTSGEKHPGAGKAAGAAAVGAGVAGAGAYAAMHRGEGHGAEPATPAGVTAPADDETAVIQRGDAAQGRTATETLDPQGAAHPGYHDPEADAGVYGGEVSEVHESDWDAEPKRGGIGQWILLAFQVLGAAVAGAALFVAFQLLWDDLKWVALALAIVVILGLVAIVRVLRRGNDWVSIGLAVVVGAGVTFGPLLLKLVT